MGSGGTKQGAELHEDLYPSLTAYMFTGRLPNPRHGRTTRDFRLGLAEEPRRPKSGF